MTGGNALRPHFPAPGEGLGLLENWLGCTLPESQQEAGFRLAPLARREHPDGEITRGRAPNDKQRRGKDEERYHRRRRVERPPRRLSAREGLRGPAPQYCSTAQPLVLCIALGVSARVAATRSKRMYHVLRNSRCSLTLRSRALDRLPKFPGSPSTRNRIYG
jgi:hypothetical protein